MAMTKVSVIIPVYQVEKYLERCVDSVLDQSYIDYEIILVDDGSTDRSSEICDDYAHTHNNVLVVHKQNGGLSSARNDGLKVATGEYVLFVDSDDLIHFKTLEIELSLLEKFNAQAVISSMKRFKREEEINLFAEIDISNYQVLNGTEVQLGFFNNPNVANYVTTCGHLFSKSLFDDIQFPEGRLFEDEYVSYKLYYECERVVVFDEPLYFYYMNDAGITQNLDLDKRFDEYDAQMERMYFYKKHGNNQLCGLALLEFLRSAQWDLLVCQKRNQAFNTLRGAKLQNQYKEALLLARKMDLVSFENNYDYYVLAYPEKNLILRIKRKLFNLYKQINCYIQKK